MKSAVSELATLFDVDAVYTNNETKPAVTLFMAQDYLSGSSACKWYFNPDIPQAEEFYSRFENQHIELRRVASVPHQPLHPQPPPQQELKYLHEAQSINPMSFHEMDAYAQLPSLDWFGMYLGGFFHVQSVEKHSVQKAVAIYATLTTAPTTDTNISCCPWLCHRSSGDDMLWSSCSAYCCKTC